MKTKMSKLQKKVLCIFNRIYFLGISQDEGLSSLLGMFDNSHRSNVLVEKVKSLVKSVILSEDDDCTDQATKDFLILLNVYDKERNNWKKLLEDEMKKRNESFDDFIDCTISNEDLEEPFLGSFGNELKGEEFTLWTENTVYFSSYEDGNEYNGYNSYNEVKFVKRNP